MLLLVVLVGLLVVLFVVKDMNKERDPYQEFDAYFASRADVIKATVPLKKDYSPITWPELGKLNMVEMTAIFQTSGRTDMLASTLYTFFKYNTYPLKKVMAIHDG